MNNILKQESKKYDKAWKCGAENQSRTAEHVLNYVSEIIKPNWKTLEIGFGNGLISNTLHDKGYDIKGIDITLTGLKEPKSYLSKATLWDLPFENAEFDFSFSTDVLEHLPTDLVEQSIEEIFRVTKIKTFHCIALFADNRHNFNFHLTVKPLDWWEEKFSDLNNNHIDVELVDRKPFLVEQIEKSIRRKIDEK